MRIRDLTVLAAVGAVAMSMASCGIPESSDPQVIEEAPTDFDESSSNPVEEFLPSVDARTTVQNYFKAAAGDPNGRDQRLQVFTEDDIEFSDPAEGIRLLADVRYELAEGEDISSETVTVTGSIIGTYLPDGQVRMSSTPQEYEEEFDLQREGLQDAWTFAELPAQVALTYEQFTNVYEQAPLYFQAAGESGLLVPDLRWIFDQLDADTARGIRLGWLVQGPSEWVEQSARSAIPSGTTVKNSDEDGVVHIDLDLGDVADTGAVDVDSVAAQVAWSLGLEGDFVLTIDGGEVADGDLDDYRDWNAIPENLEELGYFVSDDTVWQVENDVTTDSSADHPWVGFTADGLEQVAVADNDQIAAIVAGSMEPILQVGSGTDSMTTVPGISGDLHDPQWLADGTVVLVDDGTLIAVDPESGATQVLAGDEITALAVAADGRRLAYVEDGSAAVAPLNLDADGNLLLGDDRPIGLSIGDVTDVAWSSEDYLWVAGRDDGSDEQLFRVAIDNSRVEAQAGASGFPSITAIAANPADPAEPNQNRGEPVIVSIGSNLYRVHSESLQPLDGGSGDPINGSAPFTVLQ
ncbi:LpqB family beta-propeller domain-containing protein [Glycomyces buryatensis]|uniref:GerMN domain-containing protein n=1 Tax=Glycomyces buryatensis TaxID=2570927 RepID=A0A4S8QJJ2_9ACTN|nr:LpqB family beta-propeller domain-containing protein [Glycomyces buryatensis]THV43175.1 hypothetical protein FAB82_02800 [Glycomyces buryatensis]